MESVPTGILCKIFSFLKIDEKARIMRVSKKWREVAGELIRRQEILVCNADPYFVHHSCHTHRYRSVDVISFALYLKLTTKGRLTQLMPSIKVLVLGFGLPQVLKLIHSYW